MKLHLAKRNINLLNIRNNHVVVIDPDEMDYETMGIFGKFNHDTKNNEEQTRFIKTVASAILFSLSPILLKSTIDGSKFNYMQAIKAKAFYFLIMPESPYSEYPTESIKILVDMISNEVLTQALKTDTEDPQTNKTIIDLVY